MDQAIAAALGWGVLLGGAGALLLVLGRRAAAIGVLAPLAVGVALRLVVMLIAHAGSVSLGDRGILFLDDYTYLSGSAELAGLWRDGHTADPTRSDLLGTYQLGYHLFLASIFTLGTPSVLLGKLANVLLGGVTVYLVARIAGRLLGEAARVRAAWLAALAPSLVWWSAPLLKEALVTALLATGILAVTYLPRPRAVAVLTTVLGALALVRVSAALALIVGAATAVVLATRPVPREGLYRRVAVGAATLVAGLFAVTLAVSRGDLHALYVSYEAIVPRMIDQYQGGDLTRVPYDAAKSLVTPVPWVFDEGTRNWDRALFPGVWLLMCAYPLAVVGCWRLRHRPELWLLVTTVTTALAINVVTAGFVFRQRSMLEPLVLLLAVAGAPSWRFVGRCVSAALAVVAVAAAIQSRSPVPPLVILAAAAATLLVTRRLPSRPFGPLPDSAMVAGFRMSADSPPASLRSAAAAAHAMLVRAAPPLRLAERDRSLMPERRVADL